VKNTVYSASIEITTWKANTPIVFAKTSPHVLDPPTFALHLGLHFVTKYAHITKAFIDIIALKWSRIEVREHTSISEYPPLKQDSR
jgi:urate oxidase